MRQGGIMLCRLRFLLSTFIAMAVQPVIGGQAVMEGVMMRSPKSFAIAVRRKDGQIVLREREWLSFSERLPFLRWPLLRGATMLVESMYNGMSALQFSAEQAIQDASPKQATAPQESSKSKDVALLATMGFSLILGIALFKAVPHLTAFAIGQLLGHDGNSALPITSAGFHLVDGVIKMTLFVGYILLISRFDDVKRLFMYHGAEHKSVHAYEKKLALDTQNARIQSTAHPRCGTSLILLVLAVSIVVFAIIIPYLPVVSDNQLVQSLFSLAIKIPLMLPIAGIAYEFQRASAKNPDNMLIKAVIAPGMLMQRLTTKEPTDDQLEVALAALRKALWREEISRQEENMPINAVDSLEVFANFSEVCQKV